jgi:hypothetical protein
MTSSSLPSSGEPKVAFARVIWLRVNENGEIFAEFAAPSCANLLARNADRGEGRSMCTAKDPALVIVLAAEEGVLMLKETSGCGFREKQLKDERVIPRHVWGELDVADVTITTLIKERKKY